MKSALKKLAFAAATVAVSLGVTSAHAENDPATIVVPASGLVSSGGVFGPGFGCSEALVPGICADIFNFDLSAFSAAPAVTMDFDIRSLAFGPFVPVAGLMGALVDSDFSAIAFSGATPATFSVTVSSASTFGDGFHRLVVMGSTPDATNLSGYSIALSVTPVPEPQSYALMLAGGALLGWVALRRRKQG
jgi:hypothetical protein